MWRLPHFVIPAALVLLGLNSAVRAAETGLGQVDVAQAADFSRVGANQKEALKINDAIYQGIGFGKTFLVTTSEGNVFIEPSMGNMASRNLSLIHT